MQREQKHWFSPVRNIWKKWICFPSCFQDYKIICQVWYQVSIKFHLVLNCLRTPEGSYEFSRLQPREILENFSVALSWISGSGPEHSRSHCDTSRYTELWELESLRFGEQEICIVCDDWCFMDLKNDGPFPCPPLLCFAVLKDVSWGCIVYFWNLCFFAQC